MLEKLVHAYKGVGTLIKHSVLSERIVKKKSTFKEINENSIYQNRELYQVNISICLKGNKCIDRYPIHSLTIAYFILLPQILLLLIFSSGGGIIIG